MIAFTKEFWLNPANEWFRIARDLFRATAVEHTPDYDGAERFEVAEDLGDAGLLLSRVIGRRDTHKLIIDLDMPAALVPSSTPGHYHLYIDHEMSWEAYENVLFSLMAAGIIEPGYFSAAVDRQYTSLRTPWTPKPEPVSIELEPPTE